MGRSKWPPPNQTTPPRSQRTELINVAQWGGIGNRDDGDLRARARAGARTRRVGERGNDDEDNCNDKSKVNRRLARYSGSAAGVPGGLPVGAGKPFDGRDHGLDGVGQVVEVDVSEIVGGPVVVRAESVAGNGLGDDAAAGKVEVVRALEEVLGGMGIGDERRAVCGERGTEIGAFPSAKPELAGTDGAVGLADHLELEIGDDGWERRGRVVEEILVALAAGFLVLPKKQTKTMVRRGRVEASRGRGGSPRTAVVPRWHRHRPRDR